MSERKLLPASQKYRALADECLKKAQSFRDARARRQMLKLADEYERKAKEAASSEIVVDE